MLQTKINITAFNWSIKPNPSRLSNNEFNRGCRDYEFYSNWLFEQFISMWRYVCDWKCIFYIINSNINIWIIELTIFCSQLPWRSFEMHIFGIWQKRTTKLCHTQIVGSASLTHTHTRAYTHTQWWRAHLIPFSRQTLRIKVKQRADFHSNRVW